MAPAIRDRAVPFCPPRYQLFVANPRAGRIRDGRCGWPYQEVCAADAFCVSKVKKNSFM